MENCFVRKDFYIDPPSKDSSKEDWAKWIKKDDRKARAHKALYTRSFKQEDAPDEYQAHTQRKIGGVWRQTSAIGFTGGDEEHSNVEPIVESDQEKLAILRRMEEHRNVRGGSKKGKSARRRANRKARKGQ
jgi:hypothetical protein